MFEITDVQKIGVGLAAFGVSFLFLGVLLIFDKGLLAIGNILFISGLACVIGLERTFRFFFQRHKAKASISFFGGISVVLFGYPLIGMLLETYGFILLFSYIHLVEFEPWIIGGVMVCYSGFFPVAINFLRRVPFVGFVLNLPLISRVVDKLAGDSNRTTV